jgi:hypothetical protein
MLARVFKNSSLIKSENIKTIFTLLQSSQKPKNTFTLCFSCIIALVYFISSYLFYCIYYFIFLTFNTLCLTTIRRSRDARQGDYFVSCVTRTNRAFLTVPQEFDISPELSLWGETTLATTLCTWSPNKVAHCLVSSRLFFGIVAFTTTCFHERRFFLDIGIILWRHATS